MRMLLGHMHSALEADSADEATKSQRMPGRYEGYMVAKLELGSLDVGAFAFRTTLGQEVGYLHRDHTADWKFADALLQRLKGLHMRSHYIHRTLYVHN